MGNDGGSIPTRRELVKEAARLPSSTEVKQLQHERQEHYWTTDPISQKPLMEPVVSDASGKLFNKDTIIELLVDGTRAEEAERETQGYIKSLKDIVEVKFDLDDDAISSTGKPEKRSWRCPITGETLGPGSKAVYLVPCGHAFSSSAIKEVSGEKCVKCDTAYAANDIIPILPTSQTDLARLSLRLKTLHEKGLTHSLKSASNSKKRKKDRHPTKADLGHRPGTDVPPNDVAATHEQSTHLGVPVDDKASTNHSSAATIAAKVLEEQNRSKKRRMESENVRSLFSHHDSANPERVNGDFMTRGFSMHSANNR